MYTTTLQKPIKLITLAAITFWIVTSLNFIQLNLVMLNSVEIFLKSCFKRNALQLNPLSQISTCLEVAFQSQIFKSIQIKFAMSKL